MTEHENAKSYDSASGVLTRETTKRDSESALALTSIATTRGSGRKVMPEYSTHAEDPWDERISLEHVQVGVGRMVSIKVAAGEGVRPVPPPKDWPRRS